jgi:exonuclease III
VSESAVKCVSWNIEGLTKQKREDRDFTKFISSFDLIFLSETWTNKGSKIDLEGYKLIHSYRKIQNRRAKRNSGGILVYIKNDLFKGIKLLKNDIDFLLWIKLEKIFFSDRK